MILSVNIQSLSRRDFVHALCLMSVERDTPIKTNPVPKPMTLLLCQFLLPICQSACLWNVLYYHSPYAVFLLYCYSCVICVLVQKKLTQKSIKNESVK